MKELISNQDYKSAVSLFERYVDMTKERRNNPGADPTVFKSEFVMPAALCNEYFNAVIRGLEPSRHLRKLEWALSEMQNTYKVQPSVPLYNRLLMNYVERGAWQNIGAMEEVWEEMRRHRLMPNFHTYENLIVAYALGHKHDKCRSTFQELLEQPNLLNPQSLPALRSLFTKLIALALQDRHLHEALNWLQEMMKNNLPPPPHVYGDIMNRAALVDRNDTVYEMLGRLQHIRVEVLVDGRPAHVPLKMDEGSMTTALQVAARRADTDLARLAFDMLSRSLSQPAYPCNPRNSKQGDDGEGDIAPYSPNSIVPVLPSTGRIPRPHQFHAVIHAFAKANDVDGAFDWLAALEAAYPQQPHLLSPFEDLWLFNFALGQTGEEVDKTYYLLEDRLKAGRVVTTAMLNFVIAACSRLTIQGQASKTPEDRESMLTRAWETFDAISTMGLTPDTTSYNCLIEACGRMRKMDGIADVVKRMESSGVPRDRETFEMVVQAFLIQGDIEAALTTLTEMRRMTDFQPSVKMLDKLAKEAYKGNDMAALTRVTREYHRLGLPNPIEAQLHRRSARWEDRSRQLANRNEDRSQRSQRQMGGEEGGSRGGWGQRQLQRSGQSDAQLQGNEDGGERMLRRSSQRGGVQKDEFGLVSDAGSQARYHESAAM